MTNEQLISIHESYFDDEYPLDCTERAIVNGFKKTGLEGTLYIEAYGAGGITFTTLGGHQFYISPERVYDERGFEDRKDRGSYWYEDYGINTKADPECKSLEMIFKEISMILKND